MTVFTTKIIKGGALLAETRRLLEVWEPADVSESNLDRIQTLNLLGLPSRKRTEEVLAILRQRFIDVPHSILPAIEVLRTSSAAFRDACYFEATRNDELLAFAAEHLLSDWWDLGRSSVTVDQLEQALVDSTPDPDLKGWAEATRRRVIQGLVSAYRDFGILEGKNNKRLASPTLSGIGFAYVLGRLRQAGVADLPSQAVWKRWLLDPRRVRALFLEADRVGLLRYAEAGTATRIDWLHGDLEGMVRAAL